jgi:hypothetical protein
VKECRVSLGDRTAIVPFERPGRYRAGECEATRKYRHADVEPAKTLVEWRRRASWAIHGRPAT